MQIFVTGATGFTYTPTPGYAGVDSFTYTATNASGTMTATRSVSAIASPV
mgnify:CR=1 FL=1